MSGYEAFDFDESASIQFEQSKQEQPRTGYSRVRRTEKIDPALLDRSYKAFVTRRVPRSAFKTLLTGPIRPRTGDLVIATVDRVRYQRRLELECGRKSDFGVGDTIIVAYGDRYATDHFEGRVPLDIDTTNLVATGGVAARMISRTAGIKPATVITPIGLLGDDHGRPINLNNFAVGPGVIPDERPPIISVLGSTMNSGKTTINHALVRGLVRAGKRPGVIKVTGTGSGGDYWQMIDAGAHLVVDFTDAGYASTYRVGQRELEKIMRNLVSHAIAQGCDTILIEIADGILQEQNITFINGELYRELIHSVLFAAGDPLSAVFGAERLLSLGLPVVGTSGKFTSSELMVREVTCNSSVPVFYRDDLSNPNRVLEILGLEGRRPNADSVSPPEEVPLFFGKKPSIEQDEIADCLIVQEDVQ